MAERFGTLSGDHVDKFSGLPVEAGPAGTPLLADVPHRMVVRRVALLDEGGDHVALTTEPIAAETGGSCRPLQLSAANGLAPGHTSEERNNP